MSKPRTRRKPLSEYEQFFRQARQRKGVSQTALAEELGLSRNQLISNIERGISKYPVARLGKVIRLLGLDLEETMNLVLRREEQRIRKVLK